MEDTVIRPTLKFIKLGYVAVGLLIVAGVIGFSMLSADSEWKDRPWIMAVPALLFIWPARRHLCLLYTSRCV